MKRLMMIAAVIAVWAAPVLAQEDSRSYKLIVESAHLEYLLDQVDSVRAELLLLLESAPIQNPVNLSTVRPVPRPDNLITNHSD